MVVKAQISLATLDAAGLDSTKFRKFGKGMRGACPICGGETRFGVWVDKSSGQARYKCSICKLGGPLALLRTNLVFAQADMMSKNAPW